MSAVPTVNSASQLLLPKCGGAIDYDSHNDYEVLYDRIEFVCEGCCGYDPSTHREAMEEAIMQYLNVKYACLGVCDCNEDKDKDVVYLSLDTWIEDSESGCPDDCRRLVDLDVGDREGGGDGIEPRDKAGWSKRRRLNSQGGSNYSARKNCKYKKKKKNRRGRSRDRSTLKFVNWEEEEYKGKQRITHDDERGNRDDDAFDLEDGDDYYRHGGGWRSDIDDERGRL